VKKPFIWLLAVVISGCAAAPSATPVYAAAPDHHHAESTDETDAIEQVEADLKAVQTTLATQDPADIHEPAPSATASGGHGATKGMGKTAHGMGKNMSMGNAVQNQSNDEPAQSDSKQAAMNTPGAASSDKGHGMSGQSSMNMSADVPTAPSGTTPPPTATGQSNTSGPMKGKGRGMSGQSMGASANSPAGAAQGTMGGGMGQGSASKPQGMGAMNMGSTGAMSGGSMGMCCGRMGSMMGKPKMTGSSTTPDPTVATAAGSGHVLHLGERDFYLDLQSELALTDAQIQSLTAHRGQWLSERANHQSAIDAAETQLWQLTQALAPNPDQVAATVREVEQLRSAQRLAFIASVSEAVRTLTPAQIATARSLPYSGAP
jgi:hypothetical protein